MLACVLKFAAKWKQNYQILLHDLILYYRLVAKVRMSYNESSTPIHYILYMDRYIGVAYVNIIFIHLKKLYYILCYVMCYVMCYISTQ